LYIFVLGFETLIDGTFVPHMTNSLLSLTHYSPQPHPNHAVNYLFSKSWLALVELIKAAFLCVKNFCSTKSDIHVKVFMDKMVAVNYINKMGGRIKILQGGYVTLLVEIKLPVHHLKAFLGLGKILL
jgi:hypothetical protein